MMYAIINNTTAAPASKFNEFDEVAMQIIEGTEEELKQQAREEGFTRLHFYERFEDENDVIFYKYITTIGL